MTATASLQMAASRGSHASNNGKVFTMKAKKNKMMTIVALLLITVVLLSGCAAQQPQTQIKSQEEARQTVENVTDNIGGIQDTLSEIDEAFG